MNGRKTQIESPSIILADITNDMIKALLIPAPEVRRRGRTERGRTERGTFSAQRRLFDRRRDKASWASAVPIQSARHDSTKAWLAAAAAVVVAAVAAEVVVAWATASAKNPPPSPNRVFAVVSVAAVEASLFDVSVSSLL